MEKNSPEWRVWKLIQEILILGQNHPGFSQNGWNFVTCSSIYVELILIEKNASEMCGRENEKLIFGELILGVPN